jgi:hypothetical protein
MIDNGIEIVSHTYGYYNSNAVTENSVTAAKIERKINVSRSFIMNMIDGGYGNGYSTPYGNHSVACYDYSRVGYVQ